MAKKKDPKPDDDADRIQVNVRLDPEMITRIDAKRIELHGKYGDIPTRSDIVRLALEDFLRLPRARTAS